MISLSQLKVSSQVTSLIEKVLLLADVLQQLPITPQVSQRVFHLGVLKSSLFSAKIEGNTLTLQQAQQANLTRPHEKQKKELANTLSTLSMLNTFPSVLGMQDIKKIHALIMDGLDASAGSFRQETSAIYDQFGQVVYITPTPDELQNMLSTFLKQQTIYQHLTVEQKLCALAPLHYFFEKMHPFLDGNGRVGRILLQHHLKHLTLFGNFHIPLEEYIEKNRSSYYAFLEKQTTHHEAFTLFLLQGIIESILTLLTDLKTTQQEVNTQGAQALLLPRRQELRAIVKDHPYCSLNFLVRRFPSIPKRTIAHDVAWLVQHKYVNKHGVTRGVCYTTT
jgi:Fic family protein